MADIDELSRIIGQLENGVKTLAAKQETLCEEVKILSLTIQGRRFKDSVKAYTGGFIGGFSAVVAKFIIWGK